jgi:hypothetical protein
MKVLLLSFVFMIFFSCSHHKRHNCQNKSPKQCQEKGQCKRDKSCCKNKSKECDAKSNCSKDKCKLKKKCDNPKSCSLKKKDKKN